MTREELAAIRERVDAATPGPWVAYTNAPYEAAEARPPSGCSVDSRAAENALLAAGRHRDRDGGFYDDSIADDVVMRSDADFIAHARQDVPALLDEVARLAAEVERLRGELAETEARAERAEAALDASRVCSNPLTALLDRLAEGALVGAEVVDAATGCVATFDSEAPVLAGLGGEQMQRIRLEVACVRGDSLTPQARLREYGMRAVRAEAERDATKLRLAAIIPAHEIAAAYGARDDETPDDWATRVVAERDAALSGTVDAETSARVGVLLEDKVTLRGEAAATVTALFVRFPALLSHVLRRLGWDPVAAHTAARLSTATRDVASLRGEVARLETERDAAMDEARRLRDLVRHQRGPLHDAELITDEEYAALAADAGAVARLRGYDELRRELAEAGSRYRDHLPAVMAATEPVELDRPMVMAEVVEERSCFTCRYDWYAGRPPFHYCNCTTDGVQDYMAESGAETSPDGLPTNRTMRCPGWSRRKQT